MHIPKLYLNLIWSPVPSKALPLVFPLKPSLFRKIRFSFDDLSDNSPANGQNGCNLTYAVLKTSKIQIHPILM